MAVNSFHKYVSAIRKSESFKPTVLNHPYITNRVVAVHKEFRMGFVGQQIKELQNIIGDGLVITSNWETNEMYAYDFWI